MIKSVRADFSIACFVLVCVSIRYGQLKQLQSEMKRIRCPKCDNPIVFDDSGYSCGSVLVFECPECRKRFRLRVTKASRTPQGLQDVAEALPAWNPSLGVQEETADTEKVYGYLAVIENEFHYRQKILLHKGENRIGRFVRGTDVNAAIRTVDPSVDTTHCRIDVVLKRNGKPHFVLSDGPSGTGTFLKNEILGPKDRVSIEDGAVITIGATTMILRTAYEEE